MSSVESICIGQITESILPLEIRNGKFMKALVGNLLTGSPAPWRHVAWTGCRWNGALAYGLAASLCWTLKIPLSSHRRWRRWIYGILDASIGGGGVERWRPYDAEDGSRPVLELRSAGGHLSCRHCRPSACLGPHRLGESVKSQSPPPVRGGRNAILSEAVRGGTKKLQLPVIGIDPATLVLSVRAGVGLRIVGSGF